MNSEQREQQFCRTIYRARFEAFSFEASSFEASSFEACCYNSKPYYRSAG